MPCPAPDVWDYQTGDLSQWPAVQVARPEQIAVVTTPARPSLKYAAQFTVGPHDHTGGNNTTVRAEVARAVATPADGEEQWTAWSQLFPADFVWNVGWGDPAQYFAYAQWHQTANSGPPNVIFWLTDSPQPRVQLTVRGGTLTGGAPEHATTYDLGLLTLGKWLDHTVRVVWSADPAVGAITAWIDGQQVVDAHTATLYAGQGIYFKQGIYAANSPLSHTVYATGTRHGPCECKVRLPH